VANVPPKKVPQPTKLYASITEDGTQVLRVAEKPAATTTPAPGSTASAEQLLAHFDAVALAHKSSISSNARRTLSVGTDTAPPIVLVTESSTENSAVAPLHESPSSVPSTPGSSPSPSRVSRSSSLALPDSPLLLNAFLPPEQKCVSLPPGTPPSPKPVSFIHEEGDSGTPIYGLKHVDSLSVPSSGPSIKPADYIVYPTPTQDTQDEYEAAATGVVDEILRGVNRRLHEEKLPRTPSLVITPSAEMPFSPYTVAPAIA